MRENSQIATILTLAIAAIFLFIVITINIGKVSQKKTLIDNACDGAGLLLASGLGSAANAIKQSLELYGNTTQDCDPNWSLILGILALIVGIVTVWTGVGALAIAAGIVGIAGGIAGIVTGVYVAYTAPGMMREMEAKFQNMTAEQRILESSIQYALFATVDDPAWVPDVFDADRDGIVSPALDKIPQFNHWYFQRLDSLPRLGEIIEDFYDYLFVNPPEFSATRDPETWRTEEATLLVNGDWGMAEWLQDEFRPFLQFLWDHGFGTPSFYDPDDAPCSDDFADLDDVNKLIIEIEGLECGGEIEREGLEHFAAGLHDASKEDQIAGFEVWFTQFYEDEGEQDWFDRMEEWIELLDTWINRLEERHNQVLDCVHNSCWAEGPYQCGYAEEGQCCDCHYYECNCDEDGCEICCECAEGGYCGCNPSGLSCCQLCASGHCPVTRECPEYFTPVPADSTCCDTACEIYIYPCEAGTYSDGECGCCCSACVDTYYDCCGDETLIEEYILRLEEIRSSIEDFRSKILEINNRAEAAKNDPWIYRAIYIWKDVAADEIAAATETPVHMVYVRLDYVSGDCSEFKFPYFVQERGWWIFAICKRVKCATGRFDVTVARYDEDIAKRGPLSNFWRFKFRRSAGGDEDTATLTDLHNAADIFYSRLNDGLACSEDCFNDLVSPEEADRLGNFALANGIGAQIRINYGPGYTYRPSELPGDADRRNQDIYISNRIR